MKRKPEFVAIGIITRPHGINGEVVVSPITDNPMQFMELRQVYLKGDEDNRQTFKIERIRQKKTGFIIKLSGINDRNQAEELKNFFVERRREREEHLPADEYYIFDLIGLQVVTTSGEVLGKICEVLSLPANDVYVVQSQSREILIPAIKDVIKQIDLEAEIMEIEPLDGLF